MLHERAQVDGQVEAEVGGGGHHGDPQALHERAQGDAQVEAQVGDRGDRGDRPRVQMLHGGAQVDDRLDGEVPDDCQVHASDHPGA